MSAAGDERERAAALAKRVTVGIVTALPKEHVAVKKMLDGPVDHEDYVLGEVPAKGGGTHAVALIRSGMGTTLAATRTARLLDFAWGGRRPARRRIAAQAPERVADVRRTRGFGATGGQDSPHVGRTGGPRRHSAGK